MGHLGSMGGRLRSKPSCLTDQWQNKTGDFIERNTINKKIAKGGITDEEEGVPKSCRTVFTENRASTETHPKQGLKAF